MSEDLEYIPVDISFRVGRGRWSSMDLWVGNKQLYFSITHIFNPFMDEIVAALLTLERGGSAAEFTFHDEPGRYVWSINADAEDSSRLNIEISMFHEISGGSSYEEFCFSVDRFFFIDSFMAEFDKITMQFSYPEFAAEREPENFPWRDLQELKREIKRRAR